MIRFIIEYPFNSKLYIIEIGKKHNFLPNKFLRKMITLSYLNNYQQQKEKNKHYQFSMKLKTENVKFYEHRIKILNYEFISN
jgi:hypothetical protein